ncbi:MAG: hypothetical protein ACJ78H_07560 [Chloroflexota bacterium]
MRPRGAAILGVFVLTSVVSAAGCATAAPVATVPAATVAPTRTVTPTVNQTRAALVAALGSHNLILTDSQAPIRPAEAPLLAGAPRAVYQVTLPKDPDKGFIVVYEFPDTAGAATAAGEEQAYLATGPGRVQTPQGTVSVIRQVGSTVVFYQWLPGASKDPAAPGIQDSLESLGIGFPIPN